jgi:hypothetical protein
MPVFYIISGYFFNGTSKNFPKKIIKLLIPFSICGLLYFAIINNDLHSFADQLLYGKNYLWFIPSFILTQIIFRVLFKVIKSKKVLAVLAIILLCLGAILHQYRPFNVLCLDTALTGVFFYYIGFIYKDIDQQLPGRIHIYPSETFAGNKHEVTKNSYAIHMCAHSWHLTPWEKIRRFFGMNKKHQQVNGI